MRVLDIIIVILLIALMGLSYFVYDNYLNVSGKPISFVSSKINFSETTNDSSYSNLLQYYPNMRFAKTEISYFIDGSCSNDKSANMYRAFERLQGEVGSIKFNLLSSNDNPDILVSCDESANEPAPGEYFIAGEGGATDIINATKFNIIEKGKVLLFYKKNDCSSYNVELHELLHVFGFEHSLNPGSLMYNVTACDQVLTQDIVDEIKRLYSFPQLPDLYFSKINAVKTGVYLNFNLEVMNEGLGKTGNVSIEIYGDDVFVKDFSLGDIDLGQGRSLEVENVKLNSRDTTKLKFIIKDGTESDYQNNQAEMIVQAE